MGVLSLPASRKADSSTIGVRMMADKKIIGIHTNQEYLQKAVDSFTAWWEIDTDKDNNTS